MSVNMSSWLGGTRSLTTQERQIKAARAWGRIQRKPSSVAFLRGNTTLSAQTVRIDADSGSSNNVDISGPGTIRKLTILGVRDHATLPSTDIRKGDRVIIGGTEYTVRNLNTQVVGEVQAYCEAVS